MSAATLNTQSRKRDGSAHDEIASQHRTQRKSSDDRISRICRQLAWQAGQECLERFPGLRVVPPISIR